MLNHAPLVDDRGPKHACSRPPRSAQNGGLLAGRYLGRHHRRRELRCSPLAVGTDEPGFPDYHQFCWYGEATLMPPIGIMVHHLMMAAPEDRVGSVIKGARDSFAARLDAAVRRLDGRAYLAADRFTLVDISVDHALGLAELLGEGLAFS